MAAIQTRAMDYRVADKLADPQAQDVFVTKSMSVSDAVSAILAKSGGKPLSRLTLISHGYGVLMEENASEEYKVSIATPGPSNVSRAAPPVSRIFGGYGLEFGRDNLDMGTVSALGALRGHFTDGGIIVVFGCAAADTGPNISDHMSGGGPALMKSISKFAGVPVRASDSLQEVPVNWYLGTADRGTFVGRTFLFKPDGSQVDESTLPMSVY